MKNQKTNALAQFFGIEKTARIGAISATVTLLLAVLLIVVNLLVGLLPSSIARPDVTGKNTFRLSGATKDWLKDLNEEVTLYYVCADGEAEGELYRFVEQYGEVCDRITVTVLDIDRSHDTLAALGVDGESLSDPSIIVKSAARTRVILSEELSYYVYSESGSQMTLSAAQYNAMLNQLAQNDPTGEMTVLFQSYVTAYFDGDARVTNAINYVTQDKTARLYLLSGKAAPLDVQLSRLLSQSCYEINTLLQLSQIPDDCDVLVINTPTADLSEAEASVLSSYLAGGGKLFLTTHYQVGALPNLAGVLAAYGLGFEASMQVVCDGHPNSYLSDYYGSYPESFRTQIQSAHAATGDFDESFLVSGAHAITLTEVAGVTVTPWLYTTEAGYLKGAADAKGTYTVGAIAEKGESAVVWISSYQALTQTCNGYTNGGNFALSLSAFNELSGIGHDGITIASSALDNARLAVTVTQFAIWAIILVIVIPVGIAITGTVVWYIRKKR